jgi:hypothetical protein
MTQDLEQLAARLDAARITGAVGTPRENNLSHIQRFLDQETHFHFGVALRRAWDFDSVFELMVEKVGISPDRSHIRGQDSISAQKCIAAAGRFADVLGEVVGAGGRILFGSGHPAGMVPVHQAFARAAEAAGAKVIRAAGPIRVATDGGDARHLHGVWIWHQHGGIPHTHSPEPVAHLLGELERRGEAAPDLVVADHGWAGYPGSQGIRTIGFADCNDPALFVAEAQGQVEAAVPLDDDIEPQLYRPLVEFVLERAGLPIDGIAF